MCQTQYSSLLQVEVQATLTRIKTHPVRFPFPKIDMRTLVLILPSRAETGYCGLQGVLGMLIIDADGNVLDHELQVQACNHKCDGFIF